MSDALYAVRCWLGFALTGRCCSFKPGYISMYLDFSKHTGARLSEYAFGNFTYRSARSGSPLD
jgi:hypothetical protein